MYARFGFRAPFIFGEICTVVDLLLRLLIIERHVAIKWGYDPATGQNVDVSVTADLEASNAHLLDATGPSQPRLTPVPSSPEQTPALVDPKEIPSIVDPCTPAANNSTASAVHKPLPILSVIHALVRSSRAGVVLLLSLMVGYVTLTLQVGGHVNRSCPR